MVGTLHVISMPYTRIEGESFEIARRLDRYLSHVRNIEVITRATVMAVNLR
jgi:hypothetical protein